MFYKNIIRTFYTQKILKYLDNTGLIKVLIGQRRAGKSYIMKQIIATLLQKGIQEKNIVYINLEVDFLKFKSLEEVDLYIKNYKKDNNISERMYLFFDEIQELQGWEKLINGYRADENFDCDLYITGSNAGLLSSELSTFLAGRYINFEIYPFSYKEFLEYFEKKNSKENFLEYMNFSGISELYKLPDKETQIDFLKSLKDSIILKDIVKRFKVKEVGLLEQLFLFTISNISNLLSINAIVRKLKANGVKSNTVTLGNYLVYLEQTYIIHSCERYDLQGKKILEGEKKYYLNDLGFHNYFLSSYDIGGGKKLENLVFLHLKRLGYTVYTGTLGNLEIDFIAEKGKEKLYIQVAYLITDEKVLQREFGNLLKINDNYPKIVLSLDDILIQDFHGIEHYNIFNWLKNKK
ncbi:ATP-binding protein [Candidatus Gracilibacteria bacterium]|nr:ATP-binding protein [Candidatus Gracilibacteria bacterium]